jgi:hypothetical protein
MTDVMPEKLVDLDELGVGEPATPATDGLDAVDEQRLIERLGEAGHPIKKAAAGSRERRRGWPSPSC